jgi:cyclopropane fatty-acyl-phospholipid synthase-like methyltransferase
VLVSSSSACLLALHGQQTNDTGTAQAKSCRLAERTQNIDAQRAAVLPVLAATYGEANASQWLMRWRIFFMACAELFGYENGQQWWVSHYLFERPAEGDGL